MTKNPPELDAITDVVLAYRPGGEPSKPDVKKRTSIEVDCRVCGAKAGFFCASNCPNATNGAIPLRPFSLIWEGDRPLSTLWTDTQTRRDTTSRAIADGERPLNSDTTGENNGRHQG